jgi:hypothetical protein
MIDEDPTSKAKPDEFVEKIDNIDAQMNTCLDGLLEKGFVFCFKSIHLISIKKIH